ncbi:MAG TPA: carbon-nitrogen hydrolase family protein [Haliangiales bacterium]|nr:carbon-nitrogen hydrolase family protein [Haliangiales bacterium]
MKIALANLPYPASPDDSVARVTAAIADAARAGASITCFPECYVPGYRGLGHVPPPPDMGFLERAWTTVAAAAGAGRVAVVLGTERVVDDGVRPTALVIDEQGRRLGFQDKAQLDPSEDAIYARGAVERTVFDVAGLAFGVVICHEGWRYPETVRYLARRGAKLVFHPHYHRYEEGAYRPTTFAEPRNTFHEKAILCRAAENTVFFASVNCASPGSGTTSAVARPDGTLLAHQPYGEAGLLVVDVDLAAATGLLASRCRY